jgi:hypothetical protein
MTEDEHPSAPAPQGEPSAPNYDEFGTAKRNLPPAAPVAIALVIVAIVVAIIAYTQRAKPVAQGSIDGAWFSQGANTPTPLVLIAITFRNVGEKPLYLKSLKATVKTDQGEQSDDAAPASDYERYLAAYPDLKGHGTAIQAEIKIPPGGEQKGALIVSFPISEQQFDSRKELTVTIEPYDQRPIVLREGGAATPK